MDNVKFVTIGETEHAIIDKGNDEFTSMPKSIYDEMLKDAAKQRSNRCS